MNINTCSSAVSKLRLRLELSIIRQAIITGVTTPLARQLFIKHYRAFLKSKR